MKRDLHRAEAVIHPIHQSMRNVLAKGGRFHARDMSTVRMDADHLNALHRISMSIFADCTNVGIPFQDAIAAVYLSGLHHGQALSDAARIAE